MAYFKRTIDDTLILRGSADFDWMDQLTERRPDHVRCVQGSRPLPNEMKELPLPPGH
ncbi:hypothetical protein ACVWYH_005262 [Bradyrhizobium sp. GM24.11]